MHTSRMLDTSPTKPMMPNDALVRCIEACFDCAQTCTACADACLGENEIDMLRRCIRLNEDCATVCLTTGTMLTRQHGADATLLRAQLEACRIACQVCGDECTKHANKHEHCRVCAEACRACMKACEDAMAALAGGKPAPTVKA